MDSFLIACVLRGNGQSNPEAGPVSWALQRKFESICKQFADALDEQGELVDREVFFDQCGIPRATRIEKDL